MYRALYLNILRRELVGAVGFVDDLRHADHLAVVVADGHGQNQVGLVAGAQVHLVVEPRVLATQHEHNTIIARLESAMCRGRAVSGQRETLLPHS